MRLFRQPQPEVRRILVGTDRSATAERAVRFAADMAERYAAELLVLQVADTDVAADLDEYVAKLQNGGGARALVRSGNDPAEVIVDVAKQEEVDVVVVGSVGMSGRREFLLANVPNRVSHNAPCTVVIVQTDGGRRGK